MEVEMKILSLVILPFFVGSQKWICTRNLSVLRENPNSWLLLDNFDMRPKLISIKSRVQGENEVTARYLLYTRKNPNKFVELTPFEDSSLNFFNISNPTRCIVHGWKSNAQELSQLRDDYLLMGDFNVIMVDWSNASDNWLYNIAKERVQEVGNHFGIFLTYLVSKGLNLSDTHVIGHSLGAHVAGVTGHNLQGQLGKIAGLDPAVPLFESENLNARLDKSDAKFVEVIHTSSLGMPEPIGHVDFYPNKGTDIQPGCGSTLVTKIPCSHTRVLDLYSVSIVTNIGMYGVQCDNWKKFKAGKCSNNTRVLMGEYTDSNASGKFYLTTSRICPYAIKT